MPLFTGEFEQTIDSKRRMAICSALRNGVMPGEGDSFYAVISSDQHLWLYPSKYWEKLSARMRSSGASARQMRRLFATARELKPDKQGRVVLPEESMRRANVTEDVVLVGFRDHIEVWPLTEWREDEEQELMDPSEMLLTAGDQLLAEMSAGDDGTAPV